MRKSISILLPSFHAELEGGHAVDLTLSEPFADLEISGNEFRGSGCSVIEIVPETAAGSSETVHRNIRIHGNHFPDCASPFLRVRNTEDLLCDIPPAFISGSRGK